MFFYYSGIAVWSLFVLILLVIFTEALSFGIAVVVTGFEIVYMIRRRTPLYTVGHLLVNCWTVAFSEGRLDAMTSGARKAFGKVSIEKVQS